MKNSDSEPFFFRNAPISEALIDIRVKTEEGVDAGVLENLYEEIKEAYPGKKTQHKFEGKFEFKPGESAATAESETINGYIFSSSDKKRIFQARIDGFTINRIRPYENWDTFRNEALTLWKLYSAAVSPIITRVALRYINKLDIPLYPQTSIDFNDYLVAAPIVPEGLPQGVSSFLTRVVIHDPETDASAIITQAFEQIVDPQFVPVVLDIDVFRAKDLFDEEEAWQAFEKLRDLKNKIFQASITEKMKELLK